MLERVAGEFVQTRGAVRGGDVAVHALQPGNLEQPSAMPLA